MCIFINGRTPRIVSTSYNAKLLNKWINVMSEFDGKVICKGKFYELYDKFYEENKLEIINFFTTRFVGSSSELSKLLPYHSRYADSVEERVLPKDKLSYRGKTNDIYVTAYKEDGTLCQPIKIKKVILIDFVKRKYNGQVPNEICKEQFKYLKELMNKYELETFGVKDWMDIRNNNINQDSIKYDIARRSNYPLLLTKSQAIFNDEIGLILKDV